MNREQTMVREFHEKFGFTINDSPVLIDYDLGMVRHKHNFIFNEAMESRSETK